MGCGSRRERRRHPPHPLARGSALNHHVHLHSCVTDGVFVPAAAADMLAWENSRFSVDASVRITLVDRDVPSYFQSLEHLLRYCARPP
jgi:hypothetical protein